MIKKRKCNICEYQALSLTALRHHVTRHPPSKSRSQALRTISKLENAMETPVLRKRKDSDSISLQDSFRALLPAEFEDSSSSSPESLSPFGQVSLKQVVTATPVEGTRAKPPSTTLDNLAFQLGVIFSPSVSARREEPPALPPVLSTEAAPEASVVFLTPLHNGPWKSPY
ncbi:hypothetical protein TNIN_34041 [Trichonephila inaurata madagascariensis]|uniref:C2H2-type domain-containing protein n=1 Tax=Trichonephila inaurata madagascariensis TaxID=2747483 RepID=A0A8X6IC38_9ARAC|nr:hypothetical protein TNIN_34041 [Trichonephila inaurata madagascariensis]